jgi:hypothetical protein
MVEAFLPRTTEDAQLASYRTFNDQMQKYAADSKAQDRAQRLLQRYQKRPWLSPGVATAFTKWEEQFGTTAARGLAGAAFTASQDSDATQKSINDQLEDFVATKDFQRQVKAHREKKQDDGGGFWSDVVDNVPVVGAIKGAVEGKSLGEVALRSVPGAKLATTVDKAAFDGSSELPGVGPAIKGAARVGFTALESPWQEVQAAGSSVIAHTFGAVQDAAQTAVSGRPPVSNDLGSVAPSLTNPVNPADNGLIIGNQTPFGTSSGAIALSHLAQGEDVDLGTGFLPGGQVEKEHERAVRNIAAFKYDGQKHFATPGRLFAATVTEPGTAPYNVLSGAVDAAAIIKGDPANFALTKLGEVKEARKGFAAASEIEGAGGFKSWVRSFVDPPTVDRYLAGKDGTALKHALVDMGPDQFAELGRRTNWSWDVDTMNGVIAARTPEDVEAVLRPALGTTIDRQPALTSFSANIRNATAQYAALSEIPGIRLNLGADALSGPSGSLKALYNHGLGLGLDDTEISHHLYDIASSAGRVERSEALIKYMSMEHSGLVARGVPEDVASKLTRFARDDLAGNARVYFDRQAATGEFVPGLVVGGTPYPLDKPYLLSEHLGDSIYLNPLQGKGGRNEALYKYGRVLGIPGSSYNEMTDEFGLAQQGVAAGLAAFGRGAKNAAWQSNAFLTHVQNSLWKPLALIRGAWMVRVLGEEQIRLGMAGYDAMWDHPIRYFAWMSSKKEGELPEALDWATEMGGLRNSQRGAFGLTDPNQAGYGRIIARNTGTFGRDEASHAQVWADKLVQYSEDPMMKRVAQAVHDQTDLEDLKDAFWGGNLANFRGDLSADHNLVANGIDLSTREGADAYVDGLYDRLHYYTSGDGDLIGTVATGKYKQNVEAIAGRRSLKGRTLDYDGTPVEVVDHRAGAKTARIMFPDGSDEKIAVSMLGSAETDGAKILSKNRDGVAVDREFAAHLAAQNDEVKPIQVSGTHNVRESPHADTFVNFMFANMMDRPTSYLNRSQVFAQEYYNQIERLLPHMTPEARASALQDARDTLLSGNALERRALQPRYDALSDAASKATVGALNHTEAEGIAKGKALDAMRELLYDTHRKNKGLAALQLLFPFGEAWKEMLGSWARIVVDKPETVRKFQIGVEAARGANPFDYLPGAIPQPLQGRGFFYKDPANGGEDNFVYPWSGAINEALIGVPIPFTAQGQNLSMGFNLLPGVGPVFQMPAMWALNNFLSDPKWDPVRHLVAPYGTQDVSGGIIESTLAPAWLKKFMIANPLQNPDAGAGSQSAKALNSTIADIMKYRFSTGEADPNSQEGISKAYKDASRDARWLYMIQGSFQFGAPASPKAEFLAEDKNKNLVQFSMLRDAMYQLYAKDSNTAVSEFIKRFGEQAIYATAPKTLGETFGEQFTKTAVDWERKNPELATKYPTTFALFAPTKKGEKFSYDQYFQALGKRETLDAKDAIKRQNNVLGSMWYDHIRGQMGLEQGDAGTRSQRAFLQEKRDEIHKGYPGWREIATDPSKLPRAIEELSKAVQDPTIKKSRPTLARDVQKYLDERAWVMAQVKDRGGSGDFQSPNFATAAKWAPFRAHLRSFAEEIGRKNSAFIPLYEDTFDREMKEDS